MAQQKVKGAPLTSKQRKIAANYRSISKIKDTPCVKCAMRWPAVAMDFDHVRGIKYKDISILVKGGASWSLIESEISKCDILCANCHREHTYLNYVPPPRIGTNIKARQRIISRDLARQFIYNKKSMPCTDCHRSYHHAAMDFDHSHGKIMSITEMVTHRLSISTIAEEMAKCELVCACCHRLRTFGIAHG